MDSNQTGEDQFDETFEQSPDPSTAGDTPDLMPTIGSVDSKPGDEVDDVWVSSDVSGRYALKNEIARGGMGMVVRGQDQALGRELAIKVMLPGASQQESSRQRFIEEAKIGGQLQHPGIVPVYDLGQLDDERPFFAMKLVRGQTLGELLSDSKDATSDLPRLLNVFAQVCQTVAYAHDKGVIHRDLKPANIMVGAFGEVQVMDWGLAKILSGAGKEVDAHEQSPDPIADRASGDRSQSVTKTNHSQTQMGSVLGTLAYMPPEQATGDVELLDRRADVFALGAVLCQILTGKPPYSPENPNSKSLLSMASRADLEPCFERLAETNHDPELVRLARQCLAPDPDQRLEDAGKVADRITDYLQSVAQKLQSSRIDQAASEAREKEAVKTAAAEARRRRASVVIGALAATLIGVAGIGTFLFQRNAAALEQQRIESKLKEINRIAEVRRQIDGDVALGQRTLQGFRDTPPTDPALQSLQTVIERIDSQSRANEAAVEDLSAVRDLSESAAQLAKDSRLLQQLIAFRVRQAGQKVRLSGSPFYYSSDDGFVAPEYLRIDQGDTQALEDWGLLDGQSVERQVKRIEAMPDWVRGEAITAINRLAESWRPPSRYEQSLASDWSLAKLDSFKSLKGATLTELYDHSILASGKNPNFDIYEIVFETDPREVSALRLEALTHISFPNSGPGRGNYGYAAISNIELEVARASQPGQYRPLKIVQADADYNYYREPLRPNNWNLTHGSGRSHTGFFYLNKPIRLNAGDRLRLRLSGNKKRQWGYQNLGRFRIAVGAPNPDVERAARVAKAAEEIIDSIGFDPWSQRLWQAINQSDVESMLELARDPARAQQPAVYLTRLAEELITHGNAFRAAALRDNLQWRTCNPNQIMPPVKLKVLDNEVAKLENAPGEIKVIEMEINHGPAITAIRLDTFSDPELPHNGPGQGQNAFNCLIRGFDFLDHSNSKEPPRKILFADAFTDHEPSISHPISAALDSKGRTSWSVTHPADQTMCSAIFSVAEPSEGEGMRTIKIYTGEALDASSATLAKFRCSWTNDPIPETVSPRDVAYELLHDRYLSTPNDFILLLALSRMSMESDPPDPESSISFASAALALRPSDPVALENYIRSAIAAKPDGDSPWLARIRQAIMAADELDPNSELLDELFGFEIAKGDWASSERRFQDYINAYLTALQIKPDQFTRYRKLASAFYELGQGDSALLYFEKALDRDPNDEWANSHYSELVFNRGRTTEAIKHVHLALTKSPKSNRHLYRLLTYLKQDRQWKAAAEVFVKRFGPKNEFKPQARLDYSILLANVGDQDALKEQLELLAETDLKLYYQCDLALLWLLLEEEARAAQTIQRAINRAHGNVSEIRKRFMDVIKRAYDKEDARHIEPYRYNYRMTQLAELLYQAMSWSGESHRMMVYAYAANRHWKSVLDAFDERPEIASTDSADWFTNHLAYASALEALDESEAADGVLRELADLAKKRGQRIPVELVERKDNRPLRKALMKYWELQR